MTNPASFIETVVTGYFSLPLHRASTNTIEEFLSGREQLIAFVSDNDIAFCNTAESLTAGSLALIFKKGKGVDLTDSKDINGLTFQTYLVEHGTATYLPTNRVVSAKIAVQVIDQLGSRGRNLVENLSNMENLGELNAGITVINESLLGQRSDTKKDLILIYADALYAELTNEMLQNASNPVNDILPSLEKLRRLISKQGTENCNQTKSLLTVCHHLGMIRNFIKSINILCGTTLESPKLSLDDVEGAAEGAIKNLIKEHGDEAKRQLSTLINAAGSLSHVLHICHQHAVLFTTCQFDDRESILQKLEENLKSSSKETETKSGNDIIRQMMVSMWREKAAKNTIEVAKSFSAESLGRISTDMYLKEQENRTKLFSQWLEDVEDELDDLIFEIDQKQQVFNFDESSGKLKLGFSLRWETLLREVKQVSALGLPMSSKVQKNCLKAAKFYRAGVLLQQVANFYNNIGDEMIPSTKPMLLSKAIKFEAMIKNITDDNNQMRWEKPDELERFSRKLQRSSEDFKAENNRIKSEHEELQKSVVELLQTDLVRRMDKWKSIIGQIRERVEKVKIRYGAEDTSNWLLHWDRQLYKVLEVHYRSGLSTLVDRLPDITMDLVIRNDHISFRPELENARARFYKEVRRFAQIPFSFRGVGDEKNLFGLIGTQNSDLLIPTIQRGEEIFAQVEDHKNNYSEWVYPAQVDCDKIFLEFNTVTEFEDALRRVKFKGKELERLTNEIRIGCILLSITTFKRQAEGLLQKCYTGICNAIQFKVTSRSKEIRSFILSSKEVLEKRNTSIDEIKEQQMKHVEIVRTMNTSISEKYSNINELLRLHQKTTGDMIEVGQLKSDWEGMTLILQSYEQTSEEQLDQLKSATKELKKTLISKIDKFQAKWNTGKPKTDGGVADNSSKMRTVASFITEKMEEINELDTEMSELDKQLTIFEIDGIDQSDFNELKKDVLDHYQTWSLMAKFEESFNVFLDGEWTMMKSRVHEFQELAQKWIEEHLSVPPEGSLTLMQTRLKARLDGYVNTLPLLKWCRGDNFTTDHWLDLFRLLGIPKGTTVDQLKLVDLLTLEDELQQNLDKVKAINERAHVEISIRESLREIEVWAGSSEFVIIESTDSLDKRIYLIRDWGDYLSELGDQQRLVSTLKESPYYQNFQDPIDLWENKLATTDTVLTLFCEIQRRWLYLEPVFCRGVFPSEKAAFMTTHNAIVTLLNQVNSTKCIVPFCSQKGLVEKLERILQKLQSSQKALSSYLEDKRNSFSRFFFLGDDDLLEILGRPLSVQTHLRKLFAGIASLRIESDNLTVTAAQSLTGEVINLSKSILIEETPEQWLNDLSNCVKENLRHFVVGNVKAPPEKIPGQILCLKQQIEFAQRVEKVIGNKSKLQDLKSMIRDEIKHYTSDKSPTLDQVTQDKLTALILDAVHHGDVVDHLISEGCETKDDWCWMKQLRFYKNPEVCGKMVDSVQEYSWEYQGVPSRLVHTPLTDKCFLSLTQALTLGLGGNPYGPAGTGKTESVKELGALLGRHVLVFNCDEGLDVKSMSRIFMGLCRGGAWGCFDEFNRLSEIVLSAVSMDIQTIQMALLNKASSVVLQDIDNDLSKHTAIFVTLNPAGKGYGGRRKLPDNLKALFRPIAMSRPDNTIIAKVMLFSEGFQLEEIGKRLVQLFTLCKELLSEQQHYDWGLRALKTVLSTAGKMLRERNMVGAPPNELDLAVRAVSINTTSKLTYNDAQQFRVLLQRTFPEVVSETLNDAELETRVKSVCEAEGFYCYSDLLRKCTELNEQMAQRIGVVVCGPPSSGKTTLWHILCRSLGKHIKVHYMNPKAVSRDQLLGRMDGDTREWTDGILTAAARQVNRELDTHHWVVCDGEIDPDWIEALNSVLDDNHLLTLPNGERIQFGNNVNFLFETSDLRHASPATISRMGVIFLSTEQLDEQKIVETYISHVAPNDAIKENSTNWSQKILQRAVGWIEKHPEYIICRRSKLLRSLDAVRMQYWNEQMTKEAFVVNGFRGLCSGLSGQGRQKLAEKVFKEIGISDDLCIRIDEDGNVVPIQPGTSEIVETQSLMGNAQSVIHWLNTQCGGIAIIGNDGCGKRLLLKYCLDQIASTQFIEMNCSAMSDSNQLIELIESNSLLGQGKQGRIYRPRGFEQAVFLIRGINIPKRDKWGTNPLGAFLTQLLTKKGFYNSQRDFVGIENFKFVVTLNLTRGHLEERLSAGLQTIVLDQPPESDINQIAKYLWQNTFPKGPHVELGEASSRAFAKLAAELGPKEAPHYNFSLEHISAWARNCRNYKGTNYWSIWRFEAERVFRDRLLSEEHESIFDNCFSGLSDRSQGDLYFPITDRLLHIVEIDDLRNRLELVSNNFVREICDLQEGGLVTTSQLLHSIVKVTVQLGNSGGNLVLIGSPGSGRRTAVQLGSFFLHIEMTSPPITSSTDKSLRQYFRNILGQVAIDNKELVILIESHHLSNDIIFVYVNSLLSQGTITGLWSSEELEQSSLKSESVSLGKSVQDLFSERCQKNLRIVFAFETGSIELANCWSQCPALSKKSKIVVFQRWTDETLNAVAKSRLIKSFQSDTDKLAQYASQLHRDHGWNPGQFNSLLSALCTIYKSHKDQLKARSEKLKSGLDKLNEAEKTVSELNKKVELQTLTLKEKRSEADAALQAIQNTMSGAESQKDEMSKMKESANMERGNINQRKKMIEQELETVKPIIDEAKKAVGNIKPAALNEIRVLRAPPETIRDILEGVLKLMGNDDTSWTSMKKFLGQRGIKDDIAEFDARSIPRSSRLAVEELLSTRGRSFEPAVAKRASIAAAPLAAWVSANVQYAEVLERIEPLETEEKKLMRGLRAAEMQVETLGKGISSVEDQVAQLRKQFEERTGEAARLENKLEETNSKLQQAGKLIIDLEKEKKRWDKSAKKNVQSEERMPVQSLLAAAHIVFLSSRPEVERINIFSQWKAHFGLKNFDFLDFITTEAKLLEYHQKGMPNDTLSLENCASLLTFTKPPLIIDQSGRAQLFIRNYHPDVQIVDEHSDTLQSTIDLAIRFGKTVMIENITRISSFVTELLRHSVLTVGSRPSLRLGDKVLDVNPSFTIILSSKTFTYEDIQSVSGIVNPIIFSMTRKGLEHQLLSIALKAEEPKLESEMNALVQREEDLRLRIIKVEDDLLSTLAKSEGDILENKELLASLKVSKKSSKEIKATLEEINETKMKLEKERNKFYALAQSTATSFFKIQDFQGLNVMYTSGLHCVLVLYNHVLKTHHNASVTTLTNQFIMLTIRFVQYMSSKDHAVSNCLHLLNGIFPQHFIDNEWETLLEGNRASVDNKKVPSLQRKIANGESEIREWLSNDYPETTSPKGVALTAFQQLLLISQKRQDRFAAAATIFISKVAELNEVDGAAIEMLLKLGGPETPRLLLLSGGVDPTSDIENLATQKEIQLVQIALEENNSSSYEVFKECLRDGNWLLLKNCHLAPLWLDKLESHLSNDTIHPNFILWLTAEEIESFSKAILRRSMKLSVEAPPGLRRSLERVSSIWTDTMTTQHLQLSLLHTIVEERLGYSGVGWSQAYDFSTTDIRAAFRMFEQMKKRPKLITHMLQSIIYGSRMNNQFDDELLKELVDKVMSTKGPDFCHGLVPDYPSIRSKQDGEKYMKKLPIVQNANALGLAKNAEKGLAEGLFYKSIGHLARLSRQTQTSQNEWVNAAKEITNVYRKLFDRKLLDLISNVQSGTDAPQDPVESFMLGEKRKCLKILNVLQISIKGLQATLDGTVSTKAVEEATKLLNGTIPASWERVYPDGPADPTEYLNKLANNSKYILSTSVGTTIDVSRLFRPAALIISLQLRDQAAMDSIVKFSTSGSGIKLSGLWLTGADFDTRIIAAKIDTPTKIGLPPLTVSFIKSGETPALPLYSNNSREKLVSKVSISGLGSSNSQWLLAGAAIFLSD